MEEEGPPLAGERYSANESISMINMAGLSIWYQMNSMPFSWQAWQAISQISTLMLDQDLLTRYYAYNAFFYFFYDRDNLEPAVFGKNSSLAPNEQLDIY